MKDIIKLKLREGLEKNVTKIAVFDFDGTLIDTALPDTGKDVWRERTGQEWPHKGWWGKVDSLSDVFDNTPIESTIEAYKREKSSPNTLVIMMTGRIRSLGNRVEEILRDNGLVFDRYIYNEGGSTLEYKLKSLEELLIEFPSVKIIEMWDDRIEHVDDFRKWGDMKDDVHVVVNHVVSNHH